MTEKPFSCNQLEEKKHLNNGSIWYHAFEPQQLCRNIQGSYNFHEL